MQKEERWRVLRAGFSVEDEESINLYRAIESRVFHRIFLLGLGWQIRGCERQEDHERYAKKLQHWGRRGEFKGAGMRHSLS